MMAAGASADHAREMFDQSVTVVFGLAALVAAVRRRRRSRWPSPAGSPGRWSGSRTPRRASPTATSTPGCPRRAPPSCAALAASYNAMAARLAEQEAVRREFIVNASHELRTPLTNLQGYLEALRDGVLPPDPATFDSLREEVDRLTRLAASLDVLAGRRGRRRGGARRRRRRDRRGVGRPRRRRRSPGARSRCAWTRRAGLVVRARPDELTQVLANLLQNAVRYTPDGGEVEVAAEARRGRRPGRGSPTPGPGSRRPTCRGSGSASTGSRSRATASAAGRGSGSRSCASWSRPRAAASASRSEGGWTTFWLTLPA